MNPFTGEQQTLTPDFPDLRTPPEWLPNWGDWNGLVYDPSLAHAVYPSAGGLTLRDLASGQTISFPDFDWTEAFPQWSPDGTRFAFANNIFGERMSSEIFAIGLDGQVRQLSNLSSYYARGYIYPALDWSPDGSHISFWLRAQDLGFSLAVLDTATGEVINYCLSGPSTIDNAILPLWSPDGTQIVVENYVSLDTSRVVLVDIVRGVAAQIGENLKPLGWMVENP
jgi:Tol biopolymer transport system component